MKWKFIDNIESSSCWRKPYFKHTFSAKYLKATHENVYNLSCEIAPYVMRWQKALHELDPHARLQVGMCVYCVTKEPEYSPRYKGFISKRYFERLVSVKSYEELEPRDFFENETDFQREMVVAWQKACFIGVPACCRKKRCPLLYDTVVKVHYVAEEAVFLDSVRFLKYSRL